MFSPLTFTPFWRLSLKGAKKTAVHTPLAKREKASVIVPSLQQLPVLHLSLFLVINVSSRSIFTENAQRSCPSMVSFLHPSFFFPFSKSPSFFVFDLSTRCLTYAQQSTIVTRNRNFVSMVLIKYPHQYREQERKREGNGVRGTGGREPKIE